MLPSHRNGENDNMRDVMPACAKESKQKMKNNMNIIENLNHSATFICSMIAASPIANSKAGIPIGKKRP